MKEFELQPCRGIFTGKDESFFQNKGDIIEIGKAYYNYNNGSIYMLLRDGVTKKGNKIIIKGDI